MTPKIQSAARIMACFGAAALLGVASSSGQTRSHARVVRLSFVEGQVSIQRPGAAEWTEAPMNTPLEEGFRLSAAENSFAEVEFENGSTVRLGQFSLLEFTQLGLASDGSKLNHLTLNAGYATFSVTPEGQDVYEIATAVATLTPRGKTLFRVDVDSSEERVETFNGLVDVTSSFGSWSLAKDSVLDVSPGAGKPAQLSEGITKDDWDNWVLDRESQAQTASYALSPASYTSDGSDDVYGWSDLASYGNWSYISGLGYGWVPAVDAGWYPYSLGFWCWYPGYGYVWISGEPWGWLPYHFGGWEFMPGVGWVWFPGIFGPWSPGLVTWYGGPGWIGWTPRHGLPRPRSGNPCPQGHACATAISVSAFKTGRPVRPGNTLSVNLTSNDRIERPDVSPDRQATRPGRVVAPPPQIANAKLTIVGPRNASLRAQSAGGHFSTPAPDSVTGITLILGGSAAASSARHAAPAPGPGIVYDPAAGRYVNNARSSSAGVPGTGELPGRTMPRASGTSSTRVGQPAPAPQSYDPAWRPSTSTGSSPSSPPTPRSAGTTEAGKATTGSASSGHSATSGSAGGGGSVGSGHH